MTTLAEILVNSKQKFFKNVIKQELDHFPISPKLIQEIDDVYTLDFLEPSFSDLEKIKKPTPYMIVEMMEEWMAVSNLDEYLYNNYPKNWSAIQDIIFYNLRDELLNAHHEYHHPSKINDNYGLNEMAFYY